MFTNLIAEMARNSTNIKQMAKKLNMNYDTLRNKLCCKTEFTRAEMFAIKKAFFADMSIEYLFHNQPEEVKQ